MDNVKVMKVARLAKNFLSLADELNEKVSRYFDGSNASEDVRAYEMVREADKKFVDCGDFIRTAPDLTFDQMQSLI